MLEFAGIKPWAENSVTSRLFSGVTKSLKSSARILILFSKDLFLVRDESKGYSERE